MLENVKDLIKLVASSLAHLVFLLTHNILAHYILIIYLESFIDFAPININSCYAENTRMNIDIRRN